MNTIKTQFVTAFMADFEEMTMTFKITEDYEVVPGEFAIVDKILYDKLLHSLENLSIHLQENDQHNSYLDTVNNTLKKMQP